jgi:two-component system sensor histidine kinase KdpD
LIAQLGENLDPLRRATLGYLIEEKALDMSGLLSNVLELIRLESTQMPIQRDWQSLEELVGAALRQMQHRLVNQRIVTLLPEDAPLLFLDGRLMLQLLSNLLGNAAQYTPPGTAIYVTAAISGQELRLTIEDDGPGFGNRDPEVLFEKFERGREESNVSGFGLGLAICRTVAQLHSGTIRATNRDPRGARFEVSLPLMTPSTSNSND